MCAGCKLLQAVTVNPLFSCGKTNNDAGKRMKMSVPQTSLQICFLSVLADLGFLGGFSPSPFSFLLLYSQHWVTVAKKEIRPTQMFLILHPRS